MALVKRELRKLSRTRTRRKPFQGRCWGKKALIVLASPYRCRLAPWIYDVRCDIPKVNGRFLFLSEEPRMEKPTLKAAAYGMPMGKFAKIASSLFGATRRKARLCVISWMARNRLWFAVPPMAYATKMNKGDRGERCRRRMAQVIWRETTKRTTYFVRGSLPINLVTYPSSKLSASLTEKREIMYLRMGLHDCHPSCPMWLFRHQP